MSKRFSILFFITSFIALFAMAATNGALQKVSSKYRAAKLVEMNVDKTVKSELLGKETKHSGKIYLASGKFRWENTTPEKSLLVFDGSTIWSEQTPPKEFGGPVQVAKGQVDKKTRSHILISSLMGANLEKNFKIKKETKDGDLVKLDVTPLYEDLTVKSLQVVLDTKSNTMKEINYTDDIGNLTTLSFSNVEFKKKEKKSLFKYQPPKGAQVTDL
ncbi:outer membrane lipoprotein carrier protein LolA [Bdellovibrio sp. 22V]|uniref:LolA family protein n=1 Tax=Bdellovibrio TaxID=958 RepID=UPI002542821A|nr:outer membrane lipoprotein carrier protein LolA [Bdellovibrio sp. 22V]WII72768.1 outer membrane lipoprotein carrier protein LolA [Bdellovibrio sp. 22V]